MRNADKLHRVSSALQKDLNCNYIERGPPSSYRIVRILRVRQAVVATASTTCGSLLRKGDTIRWPERVESGPTLPDHLRRLLSCSLLSPRANLRGQGQMSSMCFHC
jgi:hypothetical protein